MTMGQVCLAGLLGLCSLEDIRWRQIHTALLLGGAAVGVLCHIVFGTLTIGELTGGAAVGLVLLLISRISGGRMGAGDALLFLATGCYLGFWSNMLLLWCSLAMAAGTGLSFIAAGKGKRVVVPFAPIVAVSWILLQLAAAAM